MQKKPFSTPRTAGTGTQKQTWPELPNWKFLRPKLRHCRRNCKKEEKKKKASVPKQENPEVQDENMSEEKPKKDP